MHMQRKIRQTHHHIPAAIEQQAPCRLHDDRIRGRRLHQASLLHLDPPTRPRQTPLEFLRQTRLSQFANQRRRHTRRTDEAQHDLRTTVGQRTRISQIHHEVIVTSAHRRSLCD